MSRFRLAAAGTLLLAVIGLTATSARASDVTPYSDPPFGTSCTWHHYGEGEAPPASLFLEDPVCVEYDKRDITLDNGDALRFLIAEPARIAIAVPSCRYWQRDHWSIQVSTGDTPLVTWDGSYWFDRKTQDLSGHLANFKLNGQSAGVGDVVAALRPYSPDLADLLAQYGDEAGETGIHVSLPYNLYCDLSE